MFFLSLETATSQYTIYILIKSTRFKRTEIIWKHHIGLNIKLSIVASKSGSFLKWIWGHCWVENFAVLGQCLDLMILEIFFNLNCSMFLWSYKKLIWRGTEFEKDVKRSTQSNEVRTPYIHLLGKTVNKSFLLYTFCPTNSSLSVLCHRFLLITRGRNSFGFFSHCHLSHGDLAPSLRSRVRKELTYTDLFNHWITMQDKETGVWVEGLQHIFLCVSLKVRICIFCHTQLHINAESIFRAVIAGRFL